MAKSKNSINGVYAILCDGVIRYIGSGKDVKNSRKSYHFSRMRKGKHTKKMQPFWDEINDESRFTFDVIEECLVRDTLKREKYHKNLHKDTILNSNNINKTNKKNRTGLNAKRHKNKCREVQSGVNNPNCQNEIDDVIAIKYLLKYTNMRGKDIAIMFNQNDAYISKIKTGLRWADVVVPVGYELNLNLENKIEIASDGTETTSGNVNIFHDVIMPIDEPVQTFVTV